MGTIKKILQKKKPIIMGILNLTPDSFSDGGLYNTIEKAKKRVFKMEKEGVDIIDIGGESTGIGAKPISETEELKRVIPVLKEIRRHTGLPISIDTYKSEVANQAVQEGANFINDVTAFRADHKIVKIAEKNRTPLIIMFSKNQKPPATKTPKHYRNIIKTISSFFEERIKTAQNLGMKKSRLILDPGMGHFISSFPGYSYEIIARLNELQEFKLPILVGISRKSFLMGKMETRDEKAKVLSAIAYLNGASIIRTHDPEGLNKFFQNF